MASSLHPNGSVSSVVALGIARQAAENSLSVGATTTVVAEGTNLYFTAARARSVISGTSPIAYNSTDGVISANIGISDVSGLSGALNGKEPTFSKNTAFNKNFGTTVGTVCQGDDSRLSDARTPTGHTHSISDVTGLSTALDGKQDAFSGYTGTFSVITSVNFSSQTTTNKTITITNGVITNVV